MSMEVLVDVSAAQKEVGDLRKNLRGVSDDIDNIFSKSKGRKFGFDSGALGEFAKIREEMQRLGGSLNTLNKNLGYTKKGMQEAQSAGSGMASTARVVQQVVGAVSTALSKQTKELKAVTRATKESADAEEASAKAKQRAQQIINQTMTMEQRYAKVKKEITALEKEGLLTKQQAARALEMQKKALQSVGTEIEVYTRKQQVMLDQFGKTNIQLLKMQSGWKLLSKDQQNAAIALQRTIDALSVVSKYTRENLTPLQQLRKELAALHSLKPGSNKDSPLSVTEYERARAAIEQLIKAEETRLKTQQKVLTAEGSSARAIRTTTQALEQQARARREANALSARIIAYPGGAIAKEALDVRKVDRYSKSLVGMAGNMNIANQAAAAMRATMIGANMSFGMFTSSTIAIAASAYALSKALASTAQTGIEFEYVFNRTAVMMSDVSEVMNNTGLIGSRTAKMVRSEILRLAEATQFGALEVAEGANILARAGKDAGFIYANLESVLDLAAVGMLDMSKAADISTGVMAAFSMEAHEFTNAVDILAAAATKTKASVEDIGMSVTYVGPIAQQAGISFGELTAAIGTLAEVNIRGSKAGTSLRRIITNLLAPTEAGRAAFKRLNIDLEALTKNGVKLTEIFRQLNKQGATIADFKAIAGQYALSSAAALAESVDKLEELGITFQNVEGYAAKMRDELRNNTKMAIEELSSVWEALQVNAYAAFGPGFKQKIDQFTAFLRDNLSQIGSAIAETAKGIIWFVEQVVKNFNLLFTLAKGFLIFKVASSSLGLLTRAWTTASIASAAYYKSASMVTKTHMSATGQMVKTTYAVTGMAKAFVGLKAAMQGAWALLGGWPGLIIAGITAAGMWLTSTDGLTRSMRELSGAIDAVLELQGEMANLSPTKFADIQSDLAKDSERMEYNLDLQRQVIEAKEREIVRMREKLALVKSMGSGGEEKILDGVLEKETELNNERQKQRGLLSELERLNVAKGIAATAAIERERKALAGFSTQLAGYEDQLRKIIRFLETVGRLMSLSLPSFGDVVSGVSGRLNSMGLLDADANALRAEVEGIVGAFESLRRAAFDDDTTAEMATSLLVTIDSLVEKIEGGTQAASTALSSLGYDMSTALKRLANYAGLLKGKAPLADPSGGGSGKDRTKDLKSEAAALTKYFEAYQKGMGSIQGVVKELADADAWIAKIRAGSPEAMAAMKEMGFTAEQAVKAVEWNQQQTIIAELEKQLGRIDPRLADFSKEMKTATTTMLTSEQASAAVAEALEDMASQGMNIGPVKDMIESLGDAAATAVSKTAGLNEQWGELVRNAIKLEVGIAGTGESFDALIERFSKFADPETVERVLALSVAGEAVAEALRTSVPEADQMAKMQQALNILLEKGIISQRTYAIALKQTADALPIGQLKEENAQLRMRIALTQTNARTQAIYTRLMGQFGSTLEGVTDEFIAAANANYELNEELARIEEMQAAWKQFGEGIVGTFADYLSGVEDSWSSTMDSLKGMFKKLLRDLIYQALMNQITINANVTGSSSGGGGGGWMQQLFGAAMNWFGGGGAGGGAVVGQGNTWTQGMAYLDTASLVAGAGSGSILGPSGGGGTTASGNSYGSLMSTASNVNTMRMVNSAVSMVFGQGFTNGFTAGLTGTAYTTGQLGANFVGPVAPGYSAGATAGMAGLGVAGLTGAYMGWNRTQGYQRYGAAAGYAALGIGAAGAAGAMMGGTGMIAGATGAFSGAGAALGASSAATATGVGAGGAAAAAGSMGWVPIVGWALAIAALVDYASGGKVFGTKFRPDEINTSVGINAAGESFTSARMTEWRYKGHDHNWMGALTGGLSDIGDWGDREYRETDLEAPDALVDAADQMFIQMAKVARKAARRFNNEIGPLIEGAFNTNIQFTKKGKQSEEDPEEWWTIMGKRYDEDFETGFKRFKGFQVLSQIAANLTAAQIGRGGKPWNPTEEDGPGGGGGSPRPGTDQPTAPKSIRDQLKEVADDIRTGSFGIEDASAEWSESFAALMSIAQRWEGSADMFLDGANFLLEAGVDLYNGIGLLGDTGTLAEITDIVELYQEENESLVQTYQKLKAGVELVHHTLDIFGAAVGRTQKQYLLFSADLIESLGGLEAATTLLGNFHQVMRQFGTYSQYQGSQQRTARSRMLTDLGLDPEITAQEFAQRFSEELQNGLSGADAALWIQASESLVNVHLALEEMSMQAGLTSQSVRDQVEQQILAIQALGANEMELARARELGNQILARALDDFMSGINQQLAEFVGPAGNYARQVRGITSAMEANLRTAEDLGASEIELWQIRRLAEYQMAALVDEITQQIRKLRAAFYGGGLTEEGSNPVADQIGEQTDAARELYEQEMRRYEMAQDAIKSIGEYLDSLKVGDLSPESWSNRLGEARSQFFDLVRRAPTDPEAMGQVVGSADTLLTMARELFGTTDAYEAIYRMVTGSLEGLQLSLGDIAKPEEPSNYGGGTPDSPIVTESTELDKFDLALQIAQSIGALGLALDVNVFELLEKFGIPLLDLVNAMGIDMKLWNEESLFNLRLLASALGVSIPELLAAMNVDIKAVATAYGYQVGVISADNWNVMRELARVLGLDLITLAASIESDFSVVAQGIQGSIKDIINQDIPDLPDNIAAELEPLLAAVGNAANPKEVKAAIDALNDFMKDKLTAEQSAAFTQSLIDAGLIPDAPSPTDAATEAADRAATKDNTKATFDEVKKSNDTYFAAWTPMFQAMATALQAQAAENTPAAQAAAAASDGKYAAAEAQAATMHAVTERMVLAEESMRALMADVARGAREQTKEQKASNQTLRKINKNTRTRERTRSKVK